VITSLQQSLQAAGLQPVMLGDSVIVLPFGGRVLGLYPRPEQNVFWENPILHQPERLMDWLTTPGWLNLGGDRSWISPEVDINIGDPTRMAATYEVPKAVDPGGYIVTEQQRRLVTLATAMDIRFRRSRATVSLRLVKTIVLLDQAPLDLGPDVSFAGYRMRISLWCLDELPDNTHPAVWNLLQVPRGGSIDIPVKQGAIPRRFMGNPVFARLGNAVTTEVRTTELYKFGIHAAHSRGVMMYRVTHGDQFSFVVRRFTTDDPSRYYDVPCDDLNATGYMTQVYVDDGGLGGFGELEYHSPGLDASSKQTKIEDVSDTWAFAGPARRVDDVRNRILQLV
jgi:hypothetical protein